MSQGHSSLLFAINRILEEWSLLPKRPYKRRHRSSVSPRLYVESLTSKPWSSANFTGQCHELAIRYYDFMGHLESGAEIAKKLTGRLQNTTVVLKDSVLVDIALRQSETFNNIKEIGLECRLVFDALTIDE